MLGDARRRREGTRPRQHPHAAGRGSKTLPFADHTFDWVISRMSAHHWHDVPPALAEVRRVLKPGGRVLFVDIAGIDHPLLDTHIQAIEFSCAMARISAIIAPTNGSRCSTPRGFNALDSRTLAHRHRVQFVGSAHAHARAARGGDQSLWNNAPDEVRQYFDVKEDGSFKLDAMMIDAKS